MDSPSQVRGRVVDNVGKPMAGVSAKLMAPRWRGAHLTAVSDAEGVLAFVLPPGRRFATERFTVEANGAVVEASRGGTFLLQLDTAARGGGAQESTGGSAATRVHAPCCTGPALERSAVPTHFDASIRELGMEAGQNLLLRWRVLSERLAQLRSNRSNPERAVFIDVLGGIARDRSDPLRYVVRFWLADEYAIEGDTQTALQWLAELEAMSADESWYSSSEFQPAILRCRSRILFQAGRDDAAIDVLRKLAAISTSEEGKLGAWLQIGGALLVKGDPASAESALRNCRPVTSANELREVSIATVARYQAATLLRTLSGSQRWRAETLQEMVDRIHDALAAGTEDALLSVAAPVALATGMSAGCGALLEPPTVIREILSLGSTSQCRLQEVSKTADGTKVYFSLTGFSGGPQLQPFGIQLSFDRILGWHWSGAIGLFLALDQGQRVVDQEETWGRVSVRGILANSMTLSAPWPSGLSFKAGGVTAVSSWAKSVLKFVSNFTLLGWIVQKFLEDPLCKDSILPGGFYYNSGLHQGEESFAIDFIRISSKHSSGGFFDSVVFSNASSGTPVLAVNDGFVTMGEFGTESGCFSCQDNHVRIRHFDETPSFTIFERIVASLGAAVGNFGSNRIFRYESLYRHLHGQFGSGGIAVPLVSPFQFVSRGAVIGHMNDTGTSVGAHLHFAVIDRLTNGAELPSPMDGQTLLPAEEGKCIISANA
ncbi:MAG: hypothetical protein H6747_01620 [Deltaproteobacteria bacterium]|nr:hypothetical protein [Deltaproteobacteria bacterium]